MEGTLLDISKMNEHVMRIHKAYTQKAMDDGMIFLTALEQDQSSTICIIKERSLDDIKLYLHHDRF